MRDIMELETVHLERVESTDHGTFGRILYRDEPLFVTGELPWRDNQSNVSCILAPGKYPCEFTFSPAFKKRMYIVRCEETGRFGVRIHSANFMGDRALGFKAQLNGCIAMAESLAMFGQQKGISRSAVWRYERALNYQPHFLEIHHGHS